MPINSSFPLAEPAVAFDSARVEEIASRSSGYRTAGLLRRAEAALLILAAVFFALHFVHLKADFPNNSFWRDWAKYTDEGWYGDAAIRHYQLGHWNLPGDFNPAAALPVWPVLEAVLFRFTGVSLVAARALTVVVFGLILVCCYALMRRWPDGENRSLAPAVTVLLLAVSPFCFVFTRLAILEPLMVLLMLLALLVASAAGEAEVRRGKLTGWIMAWPTGWELALGLLFPSMVLTKTTAIFLFPAVLWMLLAACGYRVRLFARGAIPACGVGAMTWGAYYGIFVRHWYLVDYRYLFSANTYTGFTWKTLGTLLFEATFDGIWLGKTLLALALVAIGGLLVTLYAKGLRAHPLATTMLLWVLGYGAFLTYHANLQPRYYLVIAVPLTALTVLVFEPLLVKAVQTFGRADLNIGQRNASTAKTDAMLVRVTAAVVAVALLFVCGNAARQTLGFVLRPEYTWLSAAAQIRGVIDREVAAHPEHSRMVLSISGSDLSLMTGLPSICDDFGTMELGERIRAYKPGWFATWNDIEDDKMEALAPMYRLERVMEVAAFDDPNRNLLILYRLDPLATTGPPVVGRRRKSFVVHGARALALERKNKDAESDQ